MAWSQLKISLGQARRLRRCFVYVALLLFAFSFASAQPSPPPAPPHPADEVTRAFDLEAVLAAAQSYLKDLNITTVYVFTGPGPKDKRGELRVLLGVAEDSFAKLTLDPDTLEPVPLGLEGFLPAAMTAPPLATVTAALAEIVPGELSLSSVVVPEPRGYKLLLVYQGRAVGELKLDLDLKPDLQEKWLEEAGRSR